MRQFIIRSSYTLLSFVALVNPMSAQAGGIPKEYRKTVQKALDYLAKAQKNDGLGGGYWEGKDGKFRVSLTALSGMALLMEGSTMRSGRYSKHIRKAVRWITSQVHNGPPRQGLIGRVRKKEQYSYMYGHGYATTFLAKVYAGETNQLESNILNKILTKAVKFTIAAQTAGGGWYYMSVKDGAISDEPSITIPQIRALLAARTAGIAVPKKTIQRGRKNLELWTTPKKLRSRQAARNDRLAILGAALLFALQSDDVKLADVKKWLQHARRLNKNRETQRYTDYYYAQAIYRLGDQQWTKLFGANDPNPVTWSGYRKNLFDRLTKSQSADGSWNVGGLGPIYSTAIYATIMQLDNTPVAISPR